MRIQRNLIGHVAVHPLTGEYLCRDGQWRALPHFGTLRTSVRLYRHAGWAMRASERKGPGREGVPVGDTFAHCVSLYTGDELRRGHVFRGPQRLTLKEI